jgi:hypothetical protein
MRKAISVAALFFMLFQPAGYLFIFKIQQCVFREEIKQQIKAGVPEEDLVLLKIARTLEAKPDPAFRRIHEGEFRYNGEMYDIIRRETHGDTTWYYCLSDEKETQLFANLDDLVKRQNTEQQQQLARLLHLIGSLFFDSRDEVHLVYSAEEIELPNYLFSLKTWADTPPTPPPEA